MASNEYTYIGKGYPIHDAREKVTGKAVYTVDMELPGMLYAQMLFSPVGHAHIKSIDTSRAEALEGVRYIATCENTPDKLFNSAMRFIGHNMKPDEQIFPRKVRYAGDRVAAVVAEDEETAAKAIKLIQVEYEELPVVVDVEEALKEGACPIHEGGNLLGTLEVKAGDVDQALKESDYVYEGRYSTPIVHHYAMEPHASVADYDGKRLTVWTSAQNIFAYRVILSQIFDLPVNRIRVVRPTVGGGFGGKYEMVLESVVSWLAIKMQRPVKLELSRKDTMISSRTRHGAVVYVKVGIQEDGTIRAIDYKELANAGGYAGSTMNVLGGASGKSMMLYHVPNMRFKGLGVYTNSPVAGAMRGYGSPQIETPLEIHLDKIAKELGMDPKELRMKNLVVPGDINPAKKSSLGNCRVKECLAKGCELIGWTDQVTTRENGRYRKAMGFACGVHGNGVYGVMMDTTTIQLRMAEDGSVTIFTGNQDIGQGNGVVLKLIVAETLQLDPDSIELIDADTAVTPFDMGTFSSRCTWVSGEAARQAAEELLEKLKKEASELLDVEEEQLSLDHGALILKGDPTIRASYGELALHAQQVSYRGEFTVNKPFYSAHNPGSYCADLAEVEVDMETGEVKVINFVAVHDVGRAINPLMLEGQIEGGIQMGLGYGLTEELKQDPRTGAVTNAHTKKYKLFRAEDMPKITVATVEEGEEYGPFGAKSIGEIATVSVGAAVVNAVNRAAGICIKDLPATPSKIMAELSKPSNELWRCNDEKNAD